MRILVLSMGYRNGKPRFPGPLLEFAVNKESPNSTVIRLDVSKNAPNEIEAVEPFDVAIVLCEYADVSYHWWAALKRFSNEVWLA